LTIYATSAASMRLISIQQTDDTVGQCMSALRTHDHSTLMVDVVDLVVYITSS